MNPARWEQIEEVYNEALPRPPEERAAFLSAVCAGDEALRAEVSSLLSANDRAGDFLSRSEFDLGLKVLTGGATQLLPGEEFGKFRIVSPLGAGGMGEVYLAEDVRLGRNVALKLLPARLASDARLIGRFRQEARAAARVAHQRVAHVYEVEEVEGQHYIAMEYVAGRTLRERLREGGPVGETESLRVALEIAAALAAAHAAGIVHRDVKPENIMLCPEGGVKVLDFGLAKPLNAGAEGESAGVNTEAGMVLGTTLYMSPEQARGREADARSDVWSLGCVLYEMLAGAPPFAGETKSDILAKILETEPPELEEAAGRLTPATRAVIERALAKDCEARYQSGAEMRDALRDALKEVEAAEAAAASGATAEPLRGAVPRTDSRLGSLFKSYGTRRSFALAGLLLVAAVSAGALLFKSNRFARGGEVASGAKSFRPTRITHSGRAVRAAVSADGRRIAYVLDEAGRQAVWLREVGSSSASLVVSPPPTHDFDGGGIAFSPDGRFIYYSVFENDSLDGTLYRVPAAGGEPQKLLTKIDGAVSFSPDGSRMVFLVLKEDREWLVVANADGGDARTVLMRERPRFLSHDGQPAWSPDGKWIAFSAGVRSEKRLMQVMLLSTEDWSERELTPRVWGDVNQLAWLPQGDALAMLAAPEGETATRLYRLSFPGGEAALLADGLNTYDGVSAARAAPTLTSVVAEDSAQLWVVENLEEDGGETSARQISAGQHDGHGVAWTSDGRVLYGSNAGGGAPDIWIADADSNGRRQLTDDPAIDDQPDSSPDGRHAVFRSNRLGNYNLWRVPTGGGAAEKLTSGIGEFYPQWSADGGWVVFHRLSAGDPVSVWKVPAGGGAPVQLLTKPSARPAVSPDGRLVASTYRETNTAPTFSIGIYPMEGADGSVKTLKPAGGAQLFLPPRWSADGGSVVYVVRREGVDNLWGQRADGKGEPRQLTRFASGRIYAFDISHGDGRVVLARGNQSRYVVLLTADD